MKSLRLSSYRPFGLLVWALVITLLGQPIAPLAVTHGAHKVGRTTASEKPATTSTPDAATKARVEENYGKLPLSFEANKGQTESRVKFLSRGQGYSFFLTPNEAVMTLGSRPEAKEQGARAKKRTSATLRMKLVGANEQPRISGLDEQAGKSNYFLGNDARQWKTDVPNYGKVKYEGVYPGVDVVYYGNQQQLEYDFIIAPGADPKQIKLSFAGAEQMCLDENGDLVLETKAGEVRQHKPVVYQEINGVKQEITSRYTRKEKGEVGFEVGSYDVNKPLVIDPVLSYVAVLGQGYGTAIAVDAGGNSYVTGLTFNNFPTTAGAVRVGTTAINDGASFAFVVKLNPAGTMPLYAAYFGGTTAPPDGDGRPAPAESRGIGIAVDAVGNAYVAGWTATSNFPTTPGALETTFDPAYGRTAGHSGRIASFVAKLNPTGSQLLYSTFLGAGKNFPTNLEPPFNLVQGIAVDAAGNAHVVGYAGYAWPTTANAYQRTLTKDPAYNVPIDVVIAKLNPTGTGLLYSTYFGGGGTDFGSGIAVDAAGNAYVTGVTTNDRVAGRQTTPFFTNRPSFYRGSGNPNGDTPYIFTAKFDLTGQPVYSVLLGTPGTFGQTTDGPFIAVDSSGNAYIAGTTEDSAFPTTSGAYQRFGGGIIGDVPNSDAFVSKINPTGETLVYSTYMGGNATDRLRGMAVDAAGNVYVTGLTARNSSTSRGDFPVTSGLNFTSDSFGTFVTKPSASGSSLEYSAIMGGESRALALGPSSVYVTGLDHIVTPDAYNAVNSYNVPHAHNISVLKIAEVRSVLSVSAASFTGASLASDSIVAAFGTGLATEIQAATSNPLPTTLAGTTVRVRDSAGLERAAPLFFVSPTQINYLIPSGMANGTATVTVINSNGDISSATMQIQNVAPGLFTADASGRGVAAAVVLRVKANGTQSYEPVAQFDPAQSKVVAVPIDLGAETDRVFLITYGTGLRYRNSLSTVSAKLGGTDTQVLFAGAQSDFAGLDQINVQLPRSLAGRGDVDVVLTVDGKVANTVNVRIK
ncbi:MAG: SBBP repeat-containing protein [Acidobacteriota bacterium]